VEEREKGPGESRVFPGGRIVGKSNLRPTHPPSPDDSTSKVGGDREKFDIVKEKSRKACCKALPPKSRPRADGMP